VLWDHEQDNWILPVRDPDTFEFWGYKEKSEDGYFNNKPAGISKGDTLFGIDCLRERTAILLESPLDCLRLYTAGILGGVASYGAKVTSTQMDLLFDRVNVIILALDNDDAGWNAVRAIKQKYLGSGRVIKVLNYTGIEGKDIGEANVTDEQIRKAVLTSVALPLWRS
jgi:DNA primase